MTITSHIDIFAEILNSSFFTMKQSEIKKKYPYVERDISWMYFNQRILLEAARPEVPLLERLTFLGIYSNNLDEFFRVRVATLNRIVEYAEPARWTIRQMRIFTLPSVCCAKMKRER